MDGKERNGNEISAGNPFLAAGVNHAQIRESIFVHAAAGWGLVTQHVSCA